MILNQLTLQFRWLLGTTLIPGNQEGRGEGRRRRGIQTEGFWSNSEIRKQSIPSKPFKVQYPKNSFKNSWQNKAPMIAAVGGRMMAGTLREDENQGETGRKGSREVIFIIFIIKLMLNVPKLFWCVPKYLLHCPKLFLKGHLFVTHRHTHRTCLTHHRETVLHRPYQTHHHPPPDPDHPDHLDQVREGSGMMSTGRGRGGRRVGKAGDWLRLPLWDILRIGVYFN